MSFYNTINCHTDQTESVPVTGGKRHVTSWYHVTEKQTCRMSSVFHLRRTEHKRCSSIRRLILMAILSFTRFVKFTFTFKPAEQA